MYNLTIFLLAPTKTGVRIINPQKRGTLEIYNWWRLWATNFQRISFLLNLAKISTEAGLLFSCQERPNQRAHHITANGVGAAGRTTSHIQGAKRIRGSYTTFCRSIAEEGRGRRREYQVELYSATTCHSGRRKAATQTGLFRHACLSPCRDGPFVRPVGSAAHAL